MLNGNRTEKGETGLRSEALAETEISQVPLLEIEPKPESAFAEGSKLAITSQN